MKLLAIPVKKMLTLNLFSIWVTEMEGRDVFSSHWTFAVSGS